MNYIGELMRSLREKGFQSKLLDVSQMKHQIDKGGAYFDKEGIIRANNISLDWKVIREIYSKCSAIKSDKILMVYV